MGKETQETQAQAIAARNAALDAAIAARNAETDERIAARNREMDKRIAAQDAALDLEIANRHRATDAIIALREKQAAQVAPQAEVAEVAEQAAKAAQGDTITLLVAENPKRPGSASYERFALYQDGMSVAEYLEAGGRRSDIRWDTARAFIAIG